MLVQQLTTTAEGRSVVRDVALQHALARHTGGKPYEPHEIGNMAEYIEKRPVEEISHRRFPLWNTCEGRWPWLSSSSAKRRILAWPVSLSGRLGSTAFDTASPCCIR